MTSLTDNVLTFNHGSIKDVRNDLNCALPISINQSKYFKYSSSSPSSVTISGNPGEIVIAMVCGHNKEIKITSNGGYWIYGFVKDQQQDSYSTSGTAVLTTYPWSINTALQGSINLTEGAEGTYWYNLIGVVAYRLY